MKNRPLHITSSPDVGIPGPQSGKICKEEQQWKRSQNQKAVSKPGPGKKWERNEPAETPQAKEVELQTP